MLTISFMVYARLYSDRVKHTYCSKWHIEIRMCFSLCIKSDKEKRSYVIKELLYTLKLSQHLSCYPSPDDLLHLEHFLINGA